MTIISFFLALLWMSMITNYLFLFHSTYHNPVVCGVFFWAPRRTQTTLMLLFSMRKLVDKQGYRGEGGGDRMNNHGIS
ncbi:hypothetical protein J3E72DRAFT_292132 [Bipolaris maydis]|uniref:uncharacterized protein n=1 Tax=Cochliobolus heterostrophus TaxID=5016 RepID=UPI0024DD3BB4|nr:hypothetical protein J3E73DRAFT_270517 [Bipolaris maydis]KAJ5060082.1 hypothetical protein J3E74DRAFT_341649 [Bipolaris maydis]KAJ6202121.1 hypothetical protein J3E72DRAFT_292132 [Bipolaris maydis]KAJ6210873.1 hypothetical protein PSV09DRAFT_2292408 [Bipolaris maydis]KAJ6273281.1 hypothetical protein PSV08DRAFT_272915 [Bipolaris maydis]